MTQLTQLFADKTEAKKALAEAILEVGKENTRMFEAATFRVDDLRPNATSPSVFRRSGDPVFVVQTDYP